jgi:hypothetical protein
MNFDAEAPTIASTSKECVLTKTAGLTSAASAPPAIDKIAQRDGCD